jgi:hypothetical protein
VKKQYYKLVNGKPSNPKDFDSFVRDEIVFEDDLIWTEELEDWTLAKNIPELKEHVKRKPPKTRQERSLSTFKTNLIKSSIYYATFCLLFSILSSTIELYQYKIFVSQTTNLYRPTISSNYSDIQYNVPQSDIYIYEDGRYTTRWCAYLPGGDNEQVSYDQCYSFWFRSYKALFDDVNLDNSERDNFLILIWNFLLSTIVCSLPLWIVIQFYLKKKSYEKE